MDGMKGFMAKNRSTSGKLSTSYANNCGHPEGSQRKEPESTKNTPKLLKGKITDKPGLPKVAEISK